MPVPPALPAATMPAAKPAATVTATEPAAAASPARRRKRAVVLLLLAVLLGIDLARPPASQASARVLLGAIHLYQATLSPRLGAMGLQCRFRPTCSHYAAGAIARYGALSGSLRTAWRVARCGPWTRLGTYDPP
ncbi:MAG TPA: membrane protein insertion efficiency factor YidD [Thermoanaerobaculia bacterium]|nr:membrane protein insertion efficiency factor YidD [Thermoanaerobaculia bacterium]